MSILERMAEEIAALRRRVAALETQEASSDADYVPLATPLTSTSWDGDAYSTTATTKIDTSAVFGAPAGIKAAVVRLIARDSGAHPQTRLEVTLSTSSDMMATAQMSVRQPGANIIIENCGIVTCDANGDFYYTVYASGAGTTNVWLSIIGYYI